MGVGVSFAVENTVLATSMKDLSVLVRNDSDKEILGIMLVWDFAKLNGESERFRRSITHPGALVGIRPDPSMVGKTSFLNRGASKTISIEKAESSALVSRLSDRGSGLNRLEQLGDLANITVILDGVIFADGSFAGKDSEFYFDEISGLVAARKDFVKEIQEARLSNLSTADTLAKLEAFHADGSLLAPSVREKAGSREVAFAASYSSSLRELRKQIVDLRNNKWSDDSILSSFESAKLADFKALQRIQ